MTATPPVSGQIQGAVIDPDDPILEVIADAYRAIGHGKRPHKYRWMIATQDCDFVGKGRSLEVMPLTVGQAGRPYEGQFISTQSLKCIAFERGDETAVVDGHRRVVVKTEQHERLAITREAYLSERELHKFKQWLGRRYTRVALPNKVGDFLVNSGVNDSLAELLRLAPEVDAVLVRGHVDADLPQHAGQVTDLELTFLYRSDLLASDPRRPFIESDWANQVRQLNWTDADSEDDGVALAFVDFVHPAEMSLADFRRFDILDLEYVSFTYADAVTESDLHDVD